MLNQLLFLFCCAVFVSLNSVKSYTLIKNADIVIAGGSLSALAAAITAANVSKAHQSNITIYLLEPTDWVGGQLTASNVPPDFGKENSVTVNLPQDFVNILLAVAGPTWDVNPGWCWVSYKCFEVAPAVVYINKLLSNNFPNLKIYYNTVVKSTETSVEKTSVSRLTAVQRIVKDSSQTGYDRLFSEDARDWYSPEESEFFSKEVIEFESPLVVIEATEFMDVLATSHVEYAQGAETPNELSDTVDSLCGQSTVYPFYISYEKQIVQNDPTPAGSDNGDAFSMLGLTWAQIWTYRRAKQNGNYNDAAVGDQSNQNLNNDYRGGYLFKSIEDTKTEELSNKGGWYGGLNLTTLTEAEQRSYGWYHYLKDTASSTVQPYLKINASQTGTVHGLSKLPYLRDTRRSKYGLDNFRLTYADLNYSNPEDNGKTARHFPDTIGIGMYLYADIHTLLAEDTCSGGAYPSYITCCSHPVKPYYIPFRAITNSMLRNVLIPGKGMAQSFLANAATRLHPMEWVTGTAAGAAAVLMKESGWETTQDVYANIASLQSLLTSEIVKSPLVWTL